MTQVDGTPVDFALTLNMSGRNAAPRADYHKWALNAQPGEPTRGSLSRLLNTRN